MPLEQKVFRHFNKFPANNSKVLYDRLYYFISTIKPFTFQLICTKYFWQIKTNMYLKYLHNTYTVRPNTPSHANGMIHHSEVAEV